MSAICGSALGLTNEPISMRWKPLAASSSISAILVSVGMNGLHGLKAVARGHLHDLDAHHISVPILLPPGVDGQR